MDRYEKTFQNLKTKTGRDADNLGTQCLRALMDLMGWVAGSPDELAGKTGMSITEAEEIWELYVLILENAHRSYRS